MKLCVGAIVMLAPDDITPFGKELDQNAQIEKLKTFKFPKSGTGKDQRSFQLQWLSRFNWIEYSVKKDAAFCYFCRQFGLNSQDQTFTLNGYKNWRTALSEDKGFIRHNASSGHITAATTYIEKMKRGKSVVELGVTSVLEKRRYYVKSIIEVIMFLVGNRLALRGDWDAEEQEEGGLFNSLFEFAMKKDPELVVSQKHMPPTTTYKSPQIQNELICILAQLLRASIVDEVKNADAGVFTILLDGTKDKHGDECVSLAARYVSNGKAIESLLFFETSENVDACSFTNLLLASLDEYGLDPKAIICQCYDGAAVMNGYKSGVMKRLQDATGNVIPYVHCMNHRLRLVIIETVKKVNGIAEFFEQIQLIYTSFKKPKIKKLYEGSALKRLLDTRWTGHYQTTKVVHENYSKIVDTLIKVKNDKNNLLKLDGDDIATCVGILSVITQTKFVFILVFMDALLTDLTPADAILQKREISYRRAMPVIEATKTSIANYRNSETFDKFMEETEKLMPTTPIIRPARRINRRRSTWLENFVIEETLGERSNENDDIKSLFHEVIDVALSEFEARFTENNSILLAISNSPDMELSDLKPLEQLGLKLPPEYELKTAKTYVQKKLDEWKNTKDNTGTQFNILTALYEAKEAFPDVYKLYAAIDTFACSTATCEASFSSLAQVNIPSRLSMSNSRMRHLAFLAFEHKRLKNISLDDVLKEFNNKKERKVQLF